MDKVKVISKDENKTLFLFTSIILAIITVILIVLGSVLSIESSYAKGVDYVEPISNTKWGKAYTDNTTLVYDKNSDIVYYYDLEKNTISTPFLSHNGKPCVLQDNRIVEADTNNLVMYVE